MHCKDHENNGCPFEKIIDQTPHHLLRNGVYKPIAQAWFADASYKAITISSIAKSWKARPARLSLAKGIEVAAEEEVKAAFARLDSDGDGHVSGAELLSILSPRHKAGHKGFATEAGKAAAPAPAPAQSSSLARVAQADAPKKPVVHVMEVTVVP